MDTIDTPHPVIRLLLLILLAASVAALPSVVIAGLFVGLLLEHASRRALPQLRAGLWRLKWLFLALILLYFGFTPGEPLFDGLARPSRVGAAEGVRRALILATIIAGVYSLIRPLPPRTTAAALLWWLQPLASVGIPTERVANRIAATLDALGHVEALAQRTKTETGHWLDKAARLLQSVEEAALAAPPAGALPMLPAIPKWQWFFCAMIAAGLAAVLFAPHTVVIG